MAPFGADFEGLANSRGDRTVLLGREALYGAFEVKHLFHGILHFLHSSFFVRLGIPFLRSDPQYCKAGARRSCQGWPSPQPCGVLRPCQGHTLTASSTTARLMRSGRRSEGSLPSGADHRATTLYSVGP